MCVVCVYMYICVCVGGYTCFQDVKTQLNAVWLLIYSSITRIRGPPYPI